MISLVAAGSLATAPAVSAAVPDMAHSGSVPCTLTAKAFRGADTGFGRGDRARIKVVFTLLNNTKKPGNTLWRVEIKQNGDPIFRGYRRTHLKVLSIVKNTRDTYRADVFTATATSFGTGQRCRARVVVPGIKL